jgi:BolA family transcriptional regulator, general stress-responsive regulator
VTTAATLPDDGSAEHGVAEEPSGSGDRGPPDLAAPLVGDRATRVARIRAALEAALVPEVLEVVDDSARHAGHAGARDGRGHFNVAIVSEAFAGMAPLARHRAVYAALGGMMQTDIHALSIVARTPGEAAT